MANKNVTLTDPTGDNVIRASFRCDGAGVITMVEGDVQIVSDDAHTSHEGDVKLDVSTMTQAQKDAVTTLSDALVVKFKADKSWA